MTAISYQRETDDWRGFVHKQYNFTLEVWEDYTGTWSYQITARGSRSQPGGWLPSVPLGGAEGVDIGPLAAGYYWIWFRLNGQGAYVPVLDPVELSIK